MLWHLYYNFTGTAANYRSIWHEKYEEKEEATPWASHAGLMGGSAYEFKTSHQSVWTGDASGWKHPVQSSFLDWNLWTLPWQRVYTSIFHWLVWNIVCLQEGKRTQFSLRLVKWQFYTLEEISEDVATIRNFLWVILTQWALGHKNLHQNYTNVNQKSLHKPPWNCFQAQIRKRPGCLFPNIVVKCSHPGFTLTFVLHGVFDLHWLGRGATYSNTVCSNEIQSSLSSSYLHK